MTALVISPDLSQVATAAVTAVVLGALAFGGRWAVKIGRRVRRLNELAERSAELTEQELTHNHGSSIKDDVHGIALAVGTLQRDFGQHQEDFASLSRDFYRHLAERDPDTP